MFIILFWYNILIISSSKKEAKSCSTVTTPIAVGTNDHFQCSTIQPFRLRSGPNSRTGSPVRHTRVFRRANSPVSQRSTVSRTPSPRNRRSNRDSRDLDHWGRVDPRRYLSRKYFLVILMVPTPPNDGQCSPYK